MIQRYVQHRMALRFVRSLSRSLAVSQADRALTMLTAYQELASTAQDDAAWRLAYEGVTRQIQRLLARLETALQAEASQ